jgi:addiction module RelE/StbE family toxin
VKIRWTPEAEQDRRDVWDYLASENPNAAAMMDQLFGLAAQRLSTFPHLGHAGTIPGTREIFPHESYRLVYESDGDTVWLLALVHTARQWPPA